MDETSQTELDRTTREAWRRFRLRLADHVAGMEDDDVLVVEVPWAVGDEADGRAPYVQFRAWGKGMVRAEVAGNDYLDESVRIDHAGEARIRDLGWQAPTVGGHAEAEAGSAGYFVDVERAGADRLAAMTTDVLRDVFAVLHPEFLRADGLQVGPVAVQEPSPEPAATTPRDSEHLRALVDAALVPFLGDEPDHDEDGDVPVACGSAVVFVRVLDEIPMLHLFSLVVAGVDDAERAAFEVAVLNREQAFLKYVLWDRDVFAHLHLPAYPFAPEHLRTMLGVMTTAVDAVDDVLVARVGGSRMREPDPDERTNLPAPAGDLAEGDQESESEGSDDEAWDDAETDVEHPALRTLRELEELTPGSVTPELAASVCGMDRPLVLELVETTRAEATAWAAVRDRALASGQAEDSAIGTAEVDRFERLLRVLREALRFVVERQLERDLSDRAYARSRRRRPPVERDRALPGFGIEAPGLFED